jgi:S-adenosylhomocysteine hydrolase
MNARRPGVKRTNIKPQVDNTFPDGHEIFTLAEGRLVNPAARQPPELRRVELILNQVLPSSISGKIETPTGSVFMFLAKKLDEEVTRLHLEKIGVKLTKLSPQKLSTSVSRRRTIQTKHYQVTISRCHPERSFNLLHPLAPTKLNEF